MFNRLKPKARTALRAVLLVGALAAPGGAWAQDEETFPKISGSAAFVSDYRFRGISFSDRDPAVQASIQLTTKPGFFIGAWGSSIAEFNGSTTEIDVYGGWSGPLGPLTATVGIYGYLYPGGTDTDVVELYGTLAGSFGPATLTVGLNWAPEQDNLATSSRYAFASLAVGIADTPLTMKATLGHERGALVVDGSGQTTQKLDYLVGVDLAFKGLVFGAAYVGNDMPAKNEFNQLAKDQFVVSLTAPF
jgi:uncharacterized protein (TIGR02001 family)